MIKILDERPVSTLLIGSSQKDDFHTMINNYVSDWCWY